MYSQSCTRLVTGEREIESVTDLSHAAERFGSFRRNFHISCSFFQKDLGIIYARAWWIYFPLRSLVAESRPRKIVYVQLLRSQVVPGSSIRDHTRRSFPVNGEQLSFNIPLLFSFAGEGIGPTCSECRPERSFPSRRTRYATLATGAPATSVNTHNLHFRYTIDDQLVNEPREKWNEYLSYSLALHRVCPKVGRWRDLGRYILKRIGTLAQGIGERWWYRY